MNLRRNWNFPYKFILDIWHMTNIGSAYIEGLYYNFVYFVKDQWCIYLMNEWISYLNSNPLIFYKVQKRNGGKNREWIGR